MKRLCLNIGDIAVSREPVVMETILGSCVAVCLWDARRRIGGLNHFLVPAGRGTPDRPNLYGITSIRRLIEQMLEMGADRHTLQARIFGGGTVLKALEDMFSIGVANVRTAREILAEQGIPVVSDFVGAECGIRISFQTDSGAVSVTCFDQESGRRYQDYHRLATDMEQGLAFRSVHAAVFFHDRQQFQYLQTVAVPELAARASGLKIWSANCATGEEAYSIAISLCTGVQLWPDPPHQELAPVSRAVKILATDSSLKALATAKAGIYGIEQLPTDMPDQWYGASFLKGRGAMEGHIRLKPYLQELVRFRRLNLRQTPFPFRRPFDIIFCRNAMRAFDDTTKQQTLTQLHQHLVPAGFLFLGSSDSVPDSRLFEETETGVYRRR